MNRYEKDEIETLPERYKPLGAWGYFGYSILFGIPIIGQICLIIFALSSKNINRRSYARSFFCVFIIAFIIFAVILVIMLIMGAVAGGGASGGLSGIFAKIGEIFKGLIEQIKGLIPAGK